eukprot:jgi/Astpho2/376/Aster-02249
MVYKIEVVVAHYHDRLDWVETYADKLPQNAFWTVYTKSERGLKGPKRVVQLPNVGREAHTHLWHIVNRYHNLADYTLFLPGSPSAQLESGRKRGLEVTDFMQWKRDGFADLLDNLSGRDFYCPTHSAPVVTDVLGFHQAMWRGSNDDNDFRKAVDEVRTSSMGSFGNWSATHLRKPLSPNFCAGGMFWTSRDRILFNSKRFYEGLLQQLTDHPQPEECFYIERAWSTILEHYEPIDVAESAGATFLLTHLVDHFAEPLAYRRHALEYPERRLRVRTD